MPLQPLPCLLFLSPSLTQTYVTRLSSPNKTSCTVTPSPCSPEARRARTREEVVERKKKLRSSVTPLNSEGNAQRSYRTTSVWETEWKFMKGYRVVWTFSWNVWVRGGGETEGDSAVKCSRSCCHVQMDFPQSRSCCVISTDIHTVVVINEAGMFIYSAPR